MDQLRRAAEGVVREAAAMLDNGWFSKQALASALEADGRWQFDQIPLQLQPQGLAELAAPAVAGALVQQAGHWFAMRVQEGVAWVILSQKLAPECRSAKQTGVIPECLLDSLAGQSGRNP